MSEPKRALLVVDEAGNFDFSHKGSAFFVVTSAVFPSTQVAAGLSALRNQLQWEGVWLPDGFHAAEEAQAVRDRVLPMIVDHNPRIDATILDKRKTMPHIAADQDRFYKLALYYHLRHVVPIVANGHDEIMVQVACVGNRRERKRHLEAVADVLAQVVPHTNRRATTCTAASDFSLQAVDYCCWAIQRKWERGDARSYDIIKAYIASEFDIFRESKTTYY